VIVHAVGSTYAAPIYQEVANRIDGSGITLNYQLVGSTSTIAQLRGRSVALVASASSDVLGDLPRVRDTSQLYVPIAFGGAAIIYNVPGVHQALRLRGGVLADIFQERIKRWNDRRIAAENPGLRLPPLPIAVVHRADPATATELFTRYLAQSSSRWRRSTGDGPTVSWPAGTAVSGDDGLRQIITTTPGAIGYTDQSTALQDKLQTARLRNDAGVYVAPTLHATAAVGTQPRIGDNLSMPTINARVADAYPIASEVYVLTFRDPCAAGFSHPDATALQRLLRYMLGDGQRVAREFSFAPLPPSLRVSARRELRTLRCSDLGV
jgi:phosphate transport system substrate-binding protein